MSVRSFDKHCFGSWQRIQALSHLLSASNQVKGQSKFLSHFSTLQLWFCIFRINLKSTKLILFHFHYLQDSCRKIITKHRTPAKKATDDLSSAKTEEKFIKKLKEQRRSHNQHADDSRKTLQKCLHKILSRSRNHQQLSEAVQEEVGCCE